MGLQGTDSGCHFRPSKHCFRSTLLLRRARHASDPAELIKVVCHRFFFRGRRQWASAHLVSADPVERVGSWRKRGRDSRSSVRRCFQEEKGGRWAGEQIRQLRHRGVRRGMCNPLQPARSPALSEGLGGPGLDQGAPQGGQESFRDPRKRFRVPFSTLEALLSTHLGSSESSTSLGSSKVDRS